MGQDSKSRRRECGPISWCYGRHSHNLCICSWKLQTQKTRKLGINCPDNKGIDKAARMNVEWFPFNALMIGLTGLQAGLIIMGILPSLIPSILSANSLVPDCPHSKLLVIRDGYFQLQRSCHKGRHCNVCISYYDYLWCLYIGMIVT